MEVLLLGWDIGGTAVLPLSNSKLPVTLCTDDMEARAWQNEVKRNLGSQTAWSSVGPWRSGIITLPTLGAEETTAMAKVRWQMELCKV